MGWEARASKLKEVKVWDLVGRALKRLGRASAAILIAGGIAAATKEPKYILFAPLIQALAKYLRDKLNISHMPV